MRVRSGPFLLSLLLTVGLAATILLTREPTPIVTASVPDPPAETSQAAPGTQTPTNPLCENGTAVPSPAANPGLVADCSVLLAVKDTLRGAATLNWDAATAITAWEGVTVTGTPPRVTRLVLQERALTGRLPAALGGLTALRTLWLDHNQLTGPIPAALGSLPALEFLRLDDNRLTGAIPAALGALPALVVLRLDDNQLTGPIPAALASLIQLQLLRLDDNQLTGPIPPELGALTTLWELRLDGNRLRGAIPPALGALTRLWELRLSDNRLTGAIPAALGALPALRQLYLAGNAGLTGCLPPALRDVRAHDLARLGLADCAPGAPRSLTVTATGGGRVTPDGTTTQAGGAAVTLTANWNDATHSFTGWGGDCGGTASTCTLTIDGDKTVTAAFAALAADRCATTTAADCIRAVYKGAPKDYAQVSDIPADAILTPGADGRYQVERGQQITVVTAARLPTGYTRFYLQRRPTEVAGTPDPVSATQLIKPAGTTYTFTPTTDEAGRTLFTFDLTSARPRPRPALGQKPELGDRMVTTTFQVKTTTMRYTTYDTTGAATTRGSYAFLTGSGGGESAVTTYEGLRDGTATRLRLHTSDAYGASQADTYGDLAVGDIFEWREADDCWVRYQVMEVKADPAGDPPRKLLAVKAYSNAYTGCSGAISTTGSRAFTWTPTLVQRGNITVPIWHGPFLVAPKGWTETTLPVRTPRIPNTGPWPPPIDEMPDPDLGPGWTGRVVPGLYEGLLEGYYSYSEGGNLIVNIYPLLVLPFSVRSIDNADTDGVLEYFLLDGRPARVGYDREFDVTSHAVNSVIVYDETTDLIIAADGGRRADGNDPTNLIALIRKFLAAMQ